MRNIRYVVFTLFLFSFLIVNVRAEACDSNDIARLKELAKNVTVTYEYDQESEDIGNFGNFIVTVNGITNEIYGVSDTSSKQYTFRYDENGVVSRTMNAGKNDIYIYSTTCEGTLLRKVTFSLPYYNQFYSLSECDGIDGDELDVCSKFIDKPITYSTFLSKIKKYKEGSDTIIDKSFFEKYSLFIIIGAVVILFGVGIVFLKKWRDKRVLD